MITAQDNILIRPSTDADADAMERLFIDIFDAGKSADNCEQCMTAPHFRHHRTLFPEGQFVAMTRDTQTLVGFAVAMRTTYDPAHPHLDSWWDSSGQGWLSTHQPDGDWLYGVESCVEAAYRGAGIGRRLMQARMDWVRAHHLKGIIAGSMPRDFYLHDLSIEEYVREVVAGRLYDTNLSKQLKMGFRALHPIPNYVIDAESRRYGVLIVWENPDYRAVKRTPLSSA